MKSNVIYQAYVQTKHTYLCVSYSPHKIQFRQITRIGAVSKNYAVQDRFPLSTFTTFIVHELKYLY